MMKVPSSYRLFGIERRVVLMDVGGGEPRLFRGEYDPDNLVIALDPDQPTDVFAQTFLHEVLHDLTETLGIEVGPADEEERIVNLLAYGLREVLDTMDGEL